MARNNQQFTTIRTEGALLPPDILQRIASQKVDGVRPSDYHLPEEGFKITEAVTQSWDILKKHWKSFQDAREQLSDSETGTAITNERWLLPLFQQLGYGRLTTQAAPVVEERTYPIERFYNNTPIHLIGCNLTLDRRTKGARGAATASPHSMVQEYLNRSADHLWAFLSNGRQLRLLRDNVALSRQAYVEFDLDAMMEGEVYSDFALLWMLCHQSRIEAARNEDSWLEKWSKLAREEGTRVLKDLRTGVTNAIEALGRGFIGHPQNDELRRKLQEIGSLSKDDFYRQLLRIVYRLLFLFVAEDRELLHPADADENAKELYRKYYSTGRLRDMSLKLRGSKHADLWHVLSLVFSVLGKNEGCPRLGLVGLGSFLWNTKSVADLAGPHEVPPGSNPVQIANDDLLTAIRALAYVEHSKVLRSVDYRNLGSEELGSVYESLLELHPEMHVEARQFDLRTAAGNQRKITGSYYTPDSLVQCLLDSALDPVVADRLKGKKGEEAEAALLNINVCDPACGSGHFLIAAAHRLARQLARVRTGESEPSPEDHQHALRDVIGHCIYGVDINPMAVELCKVSLWMEAIEPGRPLSFLEHHVQVGNSLLGTTPALLERGIPDEAFTPIEGDIKARVTELKKRNKKEREDYANRQGLLFEAPIKLGNLAAELTRIDEASDDTPEGIAEKERRYSEFVKGNSYQSSRLLADTWCAAFVWKKDDSDLGKLCPTERDFRNLESRAADGLLPHVSTEVERLSDQYQLFHWHLAFPDVFRLPGKHETPENAGTDWSGGFDVVLGNPPWDKIQPEEEKFFAVMRPDIANATTAKIRKSLIEALPNDDPTTHRIWKDYKRRVDGICHLLRSSGTLRFTGDGNLNCYRVFTEVSAMLISGRGQCGLVAQTGLATDESGKELFDHLLTCGRLCRFLDFENRGSFFADVHQQFRFCLITIRGSVVSTPGAPGEFGWLLHSLEEINAPGRLVRLNAHDLLLFNPTSRTCPVFTSIADVEISRIIYRHSGPVSVDERRRFADIDFLGELFNMTRDSGLFHSEPPPNSLRLYEAKFLHQFDHRFASSFDGEVAELSDSEKADPNRLVITRSFVEAQIVRERTAKRGISSNWMAGFRSIASPTNERTAIFGVFPYSAVGNSINMVLSLSADECSLLMANANSFVFDFCARQKISGSNVNIWIFKQLPAVTLRTLATLCPWSGSQPSAITCQQFLLPRVLELTYTAWDLELFARDCGYAGPPFRWDEERRFLLRAELDAAYFHLYLPADEHGDWRPAHQANSYPHDETPEDLARVKASFPTPRHAVSYILDTFPIVRRKDKEKYNGDYRTKRVILEIYDAMLAATRTGLPYQTKLVPPPGPPADERMKFIPMAQWDKSNWPCHIHPPRAEDSK